MKTNHFYIGSSLNFNRRKRVHINLLNKGIHDNQHLQSAWNKDGSSSFDFQILKTFKTDKEVLIEEQKWLNEHIGEEYFYNISPHARLDPQQARKIISEKLKGKNNPMFGKTHTNEVKEKLRQMKLGKPMKQETKDKIAATMKKKCESGEIIRHKWFGKDNPFFGKTHTESTRKKLSELAKLRKTI
jgi:group I intron endonuclease